MLDAAVERLLKRDRTNVLVGAAILASLAWIYILSGAGLGMRAWDMTNLAAFPHRQTVGMALDMPGMDMGAESLPPAAWSPGAWLLMIAMWWVMMIAMMMPSAASTILLYAQVYRHAQAQGKRQDGTAPTGSFAAGYLSAWLAFALAATLLHWALERTWLVSSTLMGSQSRWLSGAVLIAAGLYQVSPLKRACLSHCRAPAAFLARHWRPDSSGAFRLGALHGSYCVGCCWMLMALLFVGGVMNVIWIAALAILVLIEKALAAGVWVGRGAGIALIAWGIATLLN
jgi:predicted metal-binding membrane protein